MTFFLSVDIKKIFFYETSYMFRHSTKEHRQVEPL